ncbi:hypothetical protein B0T25DRAFT_500033 [Lasiosphaeria hispida]|uniref:C2H2-type domain-containing protein n=1 Tax=Lasiosphaeria hispida TaxID=260671 RepID=A0AAJ0MGX6_9PEZI|nr:hypothetical protein B0T25DRAFT_500033 [Lasiosphaeria hispida]
MEPFTILLPFHLLICKPCQRAIPVDEITTHLRTTHKSLPASKRGDIIRACKSSTALWNNQHELQNFTIPKEPIPAINLLQAPLLDGLKCNSCSYVVRNIQKIQIHCRTIHNWVNPNKRGGDVRATRAQDVPWRSGVPCQQFFRGRHGSALFEVILPSSAHTAVIRQQPNQDERLISSFNLKYSQLQHHTTTILENEGKLAPSPWLNRTGWASHLVDLEAERLRHTTSLRATDGWLREKDGKLAKMLTIAWESLHRLVLQAQESCLYEEVGIAVLFEINRKAMDRKPNKPFEPCLERHTMDCYISIWKSLLGHIFWVYNWDNSDKPIVVWITD